MAQITRKPVDPGVMIRTGTGKGQPRMASLAELAKLLALKINGGGSGGSSVFPANPTATAGDVAVNGVLGTYMRSDAAPAVQKADSSTFGLVKPDNVTITSVGGVISAASSVGGDGNFPYAPTSAASFTNNINGGAGSISIADVAHVGTVFTYGAQANSGQVRGYDMAWTAGKTVTARLKTVYLYQFCSTFIYFTDGTKLVTFGVDLNGGTPRASVFHWTNPTTFSALVSSITAGPQLDIMLRVVDDGANYNFYLSANGNNWTQVYSEARTTFLTATRVGFGANLQTNVTTDIGYVTQTYWTLV